MSGFNRSPAVTRQARLFAIAEYLRGRRTGVTAQAVADRFGVTLRTVYRDLSALRLADLPLHAEQGRGGGYALDRHYTLPPVNLNAREAAVLVALGAYAARMRLLPFQETLAGALDKVRGALSLSAQRELLEVVAGLQFVGVPALPAPAEVRAAVEEAWFTHRPVRLWYRRGDGSAGERTVRVEGVVMERHATLLRCVDAGSGERRELRLDRIDRAVLACEAIGAATPTSTSTPTPTSTSTPTPTPISTSTPRRRSGALTPPRPAPSRPGSPAPPRPGRRGPPARTGRG
jgi:predicted DNA-binding transcriptional regulator YafY